MPRRCGVRGWIRGSTMQRHNVEVGDIVLWYDHADRNYNPNPAIVTAIGLNDCLCLNVFDPTRFNTVIYDGVRHIDDPEVKREEIKLAGGWDYKPKNKPYPVPPPDEDLPKPAKKGG